MQIETTWDMSRSIISSTNLPCISVFLEKQFALNAQKIHVCLCNISNTAMASKVSLQNAHISDRLVLKSVVCAISAIRAKYLTKRKR